MKLLRPTISSLLYGDIAVERTQSTDVFRSTDRTDLSQREYRIRIKKTTDKVGKISYDRY